MLRVEIDGYWEPEDFIRLLHSIESLYYKLVVNLDDSQTFQRRLVFGSRYLSMSYDDDIYLSNEWFLAQARATTRSPRRLRISKIAYGSPGLIDFDGLGRAMEALRGILRDVYEYFTIGDLLREQEELRTERMRDSVRGGKIDIAKKYFEFREHYGEIGDDESLRHIVRDLDELTRLSLEGKIRGVKIIDDKETSSKS